jgi:hypothetical protein
VQKDKQKRRVNGGDRCQGASLVARVEVRTVHLRPDNAAFCCTVAAVSRPFRDGKRRADCSTRRQITQPAALDSRLVLLRRPPPWLALPPLLAISRCFAGSIAAKPRFDPPLFLDAAITFLLVRYGYVALRKTRF